TNVQHDISVHAPWFGYDVPPTNFVGAWQPNYQYSGQNGPFDLAFKLTTATNCNVTITCPQDKPVECGTNWVFDPPIIGFDSCCQTQPGWTFKVITNSTAL